MYPGGRARDEDEEGGGRSGLKCGGLSGTRRDWVWYRVSGLNILEIEESQKRERKAGGGRGFGRGLRVGERREKRCVVVASEEEAVVGVPGVEGHRGLIRKAAQH